MTFSRGGTPAVPLGNTVITAPGFSSSSSLSAPLGNAIISAPGSATPTAPQPPPPFLGANLSSSNHSRPMSPLRAPTGPLLKAPTGPSPFYRPVSPVRRAIRSSVDGLANAARCRSQSRDLGQQQVSRSRPPSEMSRLVQELPSEMS